MDAKRLLLLELRYVKKSHVLFIVLELRCVKKGRVICVVLIVFMYMNYNVLGLSK